jgi:hypothetical protein
MKSLNNVTQKLQSSWLQPAGSKSPGFVAYLRVRIPPCPRNELGNPVPTPYRDATGAPILPDPAALAQVRRLPRKCMMVMNTHTLPPHLIPREAPPELAQALLARCGKLIYDPRRPFVSSVQRLGRDVVLFAVKKPQP